MVNSKNESTTANAGTSFKASKSVVLVTTIVSVLIINMFLTYSPTKLMQLTQSPFDSMFIVAEPVSLGVQESADTTITVTTPIREWGCHRKETPLIFVHIGKAGGGEIRARLAGAAEDYVRTKWHEPGDDNHFYPINDNTNTTTTEGRKGKFCNSKYGNNRKIPQNNHTTSIFNRIKSFEGEKFCNATTPFGMVIACPMGYRNSRKKPYESSTCLGCDDDYYLEEEYYRNDASTASKSDLNAAANKVVDPPPAGHTCDTVYVSHNFLGGELNWLPKRYLKEHWWDNSSWKRNQNKNSNHRVVDDEIERYWASLLIDRKLRRKTILKKLNNTLLLERIASQNDGDDESDDGDNSQRWCPAGYVGYHSSEIQYDLPKLSTNNWKQNKDRYLNCAKPIAEHTDRLFREFWNEQQTQQRDSSSSSSSIDENYSPVYASLPLHRITMLRDPFSWIISKFFWHSHSETGKCDHIHLKHKQNPTLSWIEFYSFEYLFYLCGYECETRYENNLITLEGIEAQAKGNLRNSFSVVGLLHESQSFYEMIHKRIDYLDMVKSTEKGKRHGTSNADKARCTELYLNNESFQERLRSSLPAFAALERVYNVGVEVNRFQQDELGRCD